jgi:hypothetical protein
MGASRRNGQSENFAYQHMRCVNGSLTCHKILHGAYSFTSHPKEGVLWIFKNLSPRPGLKPQPLGPVASTLTATPLRRLCSSLMLVYTYEAIWRSNGDDQHQSHLSNLSNLRVLGRSYVQYSEMMLGKKTWPMEIRLNDHRFPLWLLSLMQEERKVYRVLVGKPKGNRPPGRPRHRWDDRNRIDLAENGLGGWGVDSIGSG